MTHSKASESLGACASGKLRACVFYGRRVFRMGLARGSGVDAWNVCGEIGKGALTEVGDDPTTAPA